MKKKISLLLGIGTVATLPILSVACTDETDKKTTTTPRPVVVPTTPSTNGTTSENSVEEIKAKISALTTEQKKEFINLLDTKGVLTDDEKNQLVSTLHKQAGLYGAVI
ncbi:UNVERIFIED_CONTAM: hypothetical protein O8I53_09550 [Campylobacter lari]